MQKRQVLLDNREEGDYRRVEVLIVQDIAVLGHVPRRVKEILEILKEFLILAGKFFPCPS